jgi:hypothetical protein
VECLAIWKGESKCCLRWIEIAERLLAKWATGSKCDFQSIEMAEKLLAQ